MMNKATMRRACAVAASLLAAGATVTLAQAPAAPKRAYDIAAFVWPSYHPDDRAKIFWPMGVGEWETVMKNEPHFEGHQQPRRPVWGYVNEADRYVMEMQLAAAADHGVNVFIYDLNKLIEGLGGVDATRAALDWFREEVKKAGHPGLELQLSLRKHSDRSLSGIAGDNLGTQKEVVEKLGFDSLTHYQFCHFADVNRDYGTVMQDVRKEWEVVKATYKAAYYPHVSIGWDSSPRTPKRVGAVIKNNTPENFEKALREAKAFVDAQPERAPLITVNSWNEWTETSYLEPCTMYGYGYLEAVKRVFVGE